MTPFRSALTVLLLAACGTGGAPELTVQSSSPLDFRPVAGGLRATTRALTTTVAGGTIEVATQRATVGFETTAIGCTDVALDGTSAGGTRVELARGSATEWYVSRDDGLEQGFTLTERPRCAELAVDVRVTTDLHASLEDGRVVFASEDGARHLAYGGLEVRDANDALVPAHLALVGTTIRIVVDDRAATYPIVIDPLITNQTQRLNASDGVTDDQLGFAVAVSGDTVVVGAPQVGASDAGAAYVFVHTGTTWAQQARLAVAGTDHFGFAVAISNDTIVVGAPYSRAFAGDAYVFVRSGTTWTQQASLNAVGMADVFGSGVAVVGDVAVIGAPGRMGDYGQAYVFTRVAGVWTRTQILNGMTGSGPGMHFGTAVAFDGTNIVVGAPFTNVAGVISGSAYTFGIDCFGTWGEEAQIVGSGTTTSSQFGNTVAISNGTAMVGAANQTFVTNRGAVYFYTRMDPGGLCPTIAWPQQQMIVSSDVANDDHFGTGVSIVGDRALVGAYGASIAGTAQAGAGYYFTRTAGVWTERMKLVATDTGILANGASAALGADYAVLGATVGPRGTTARTGAAYVFDVAHSPNGAMCAAATDCSSGFCVDGVCCNVACSGGTSDCQACSIAAGATVDGTCHALATGHACDDASLCTTSDSCSAAGACIGAASCAPVDACHAATCDPTTGACTQSPVANGTGCDDGNGCTTTDTCQAGVCTAGTPRTCTAIDVCHMAGTCDPATGACSTPAVANGLTCSDGNTCTTADTCQSGVCTGTSVTCTALDACHAVGVCDPATGTCTNPSATNGTGCDDGVSCTSGDVCTGGVCGGVAIVCTAGPCQTAGTCTAGACSAPTPVTDGTLCPMGMCMVGDCVFPDGGAMPDAGPPPVDAGTDAATTTDDAATTSDGGTTPLDAAVDAGDAGSDGGARDGAVRDGSALDVGTITPPPTSGGCGCTVPTSGARHGEWLVIALGLLIAGRRRSARR